MSYKIKLEIFEGPLDLLLYLVKRDHLNIYDIPIAQITEQYLQYLELMRLLDLDIAGEFLVMAATLLQIKSKMLLPAEEKPAEEQVDPRQELVQRLLEYQKFKEIAETLRQMEEKRQDVFKRPQPDSGIPREKEVYFEASIFDLITAFSTALKEVPKELFYEVVKDEFTVEDKIHTILHLLLQTPRILVFELFEKAKNKYEIVAIFLAILELIRLKEIKVIQHRHFDPIEIIRNEDNILPYEQQRKVIS
ncbi:MAG: segregation/condensation protein A [Candidatus Omnitrophica bacterium]|nr:segregation/condensation protein A [Candidatus Omnitrophota bacterium]MCM8770512.1 segregation/condensation protein A [Candidatus Omnitrophota bacterium]